MLINTLQTLFDRDLHRLRNEISLYRNEESIWNVHDGINNSGGNLCLHLIGNLNHFIGKFIGETDYIRNRELEFSVKDVPREKLLSMIEGTKVVLKISLDKLDDLKLQDEFPIVVLDKMEDTAHVLVHLLAHLSYHLGQINYHRRMIDL